MTDYSKLSDYEINRLVADCLGYPLREQATYEHQAIGIIKQGDNWPQPFNPVNSDKDCMPLAWENGISIEYKSTWNRWEAYKLGVSYRNVSSNQNGRRAICEVFLMMKEAEG